ncbi:MAG TPA: hypothetical protein VJ377_00040, partial [Dehalococcoidales bacterium]|nr:hypothetical protein [Dehalococcoidales bacterium]
NGGFYFTADDAEKLLLRQKEIYEGAVPSGNSIAMLNLLRLARLTADLELEDKAAAIGRAFHENVNHMPSAHTQMMSAIDFAAGPSYELVVAGESGGEDTRKLLRAIGRAFVPNKVVMLLPAETDSPGIKRLAPFTGQMTALGGKATAYVCRNYACELPTTDVGDVLKRLDAAPPPPRLVPGSGALDQAGPASNISLQGVDNPLLVCYCLLSCLMKSTIFLRRGEI